MNELLQPGQHPDADQLSAFVEHALPLHEQQETLAHLATCADCRAIVYLAESASFNESPQPQPVAARRPWFGWNLLSGWNLVWPTAAGLACLVLLTVYLRNPGKEDHNGAFNKTARLDRTSPPLPPAPPSEQVTTPDTTSARIQTQPTVATKGDALDEAATRNAVKRKSLNSPLEGRGLAGYATPMAEAGISSAASSGKRSTVGAVSGGSSQLATAAPVTEPMAGMFTAQPPAQAAAPASNSDSVQLRSASGGAVPQSNPSANGALHSLSQQYNAAPASAAATAPPPPVAPASVRQGSANETVSVSSAAPQIDAESSASSGLITGASFGSLQMSKAAKPQRQPALPSRLPTLSSVSNARQELAIDSAGTLFRSEDAGVTWKPVPAQWTGRAAKVSLIPLDSRQAARDSSAAEVAAKKAEVVPAQSAVFELTTATGEVWISGDGQTWKRK